MSILHSTRLKENKVPGNEQQRGDGNLQWKLSTSAERDKDNVLLLDW